MREPSRPVFSRRTVFAACGVLDAMTPEQISRLILTFGPDYRQWIGGEALTVTKRVSAMLSLYDERRVRLTEDGRPMGDVLVETAVRLLNTSGAHNDYATSFARALLLDGHRIENGAVVAIAPGVRGRDPDDDLTILLISTNFLVPVGHLDQALDAHARGQWAAANAQARTFLEALLDEICERLDPSSSAMPSGHPRRSRLASHGFLSRDLNEWTDDGKGFLNGLVRRLHPEGSHPGLSDEEDCTFRMTIVVSTARLLVRRYLRIARRAL